MMPREHGGVISPDFKVHGTKGLRVVPNGILPISMSAHVSSMAYELGLRATDGILGEHSKM